MVPFGPKKFLLYLSPFLPRGFDSHTVRQPVVDRRCWSTRGLAREGFQPNAQFLLVRRSGHSRESPEPEAPWTGSACLPVSPHPAHPLSSGFAGLQEGVLGRGQVEGPTLPEIQNPD